MPVIDSMGRLPPPGFAEGVVADFGEYDECLDIKSPVNQENVSTIEGNYCLMKVILPFPPKGSQIEGDYANRELNLGSKLGNPNLGEITIEKIIEALNRVNGTIYRMGICIPSQCKAHEVENLINKSMFELFVFY